MFPVRATVSRKTKFNSAPSSKVVTDDRVFRQWLKCTQIMMATVTVQMRFTAGPYVCWCGIFGQSHVGRMFFPIRAQETTILGVENKHTVSFSVGNLRTPDPLCLLNAGDVMVVASTLVREAHDNANVHHAYTQLALKKSCVHSVRSSAGEKIGGRIL